METGRDSWARLQIPRAESLGDHRWSSSGSLSRLRAVSGLVSGGAKRNKPVTFLRESMEWMVVHRGWSLALPEKATGPPVRLLLVKSVQAVTGVPSSWVLGLGPSAVPSTENPLSRPLDSLRVLTTRQDSVGVT